MKNFSRTIVMILLLAAAVATVLYLDQPESAADTQSTDDAYVQADFTLVAPQVSGAIDRVFVEDHQRVGAGELLAMIDDRDFVIAVSAAQAQLASAQANAAALEARLSQQEILIRQADATVMGDEAALALATENGVRYRNLAADGSAPIQALQQAEAQLTMQTADVEKSRAGVQLAVLQTAVLHADLDKARSAIAQTQAALAAAELKLSHTRITAPIAGNIGQKSLRVGGFVDAGRPLLAIVPLDAVYITASFRETQVARIQPGQVVDIEVDALPGSILKGTVESIGPASGVSYSAVAPHNATGNFTKIAQRLPVRIRLAPGQPAIASLRVGMSVKPTIHVEE